MTDKDLNFKYGFPEHAQTLRNFRLWYYHHIRHISIAMCLMLPGLQGINTRQRAFQIVRHPAYVYMYRDLGADEAAKIIVTPEIEAYLDRRKGNIKSQFIMEMKDKMMLQTRERTLKDREIAKELASGRRKKD